MPSANVRPEPRHSDQVIPLLVEEVDGLELGVLVVKPGVERFEGLAVDSRCVTEGDLFVAVGRGESYVGDALENGAAGTLVPRDSFGAMAALGAAVRARSAARVVGITGSTGKTSTKDILGALCRPHARTVAAEESYNNEIGVPLTLARIEQDTEIVVLEMAMRGVGQIADLSEMAQPEVGVITSIGPAHLELLGTVEEIARAKAELLAHLPPGGTAVVPADERLLDQHLRPDLHVTRFGEGGDIVLLDFQPSKNRAALTVDVSGRTLDLEFNFTARHNAVNSLAAIGAYDALGLPLEKLQAGALDVVLSRWREEEIELPGGTLLLNDCYNANPMSMHAALVHLKERAGDRTRIAVLGEMAELGPEGPAYHVAVGEAAARTGVDVLIAVGELGRYYLEGSGKAVDGHWAPDALQATAIVREHLEAGDCVLVKGSRAVGLEVVGDALGGAPA